MLFKKKKIFDSIGKVLHAKRKTENKYPLLIFQNIIPLQF